MRERGERREINARECGVEVNVIRTSESKMRGDNIDEK